MSLTSRLAKLEDKIIPKRTLGYLLVLQYADGTVEEFNDSSEPRQFPSLEAAEAAAKDEYKKLILTICD